ncbi:MULTISPECIES: squalene/phytoene synthase family protein [unclassified Anaerobiospirillum]|uniref:squalene/phytoene synthase family protein n=1 Tax=unclassified Anaerobiospirillum TaxID=2647410 RepID=UPI001FF43CE7|nr:MULTISPECIES: squalene/phytoene synthase family protein [unclassified Anaerobiospirillum]MCK0533800.1 squalene/phytoene synthase family protein [Anaerobiospirillum sp. NML120511]MCK0539009.1 squalene/phytoene synthase family protein [Anaerobiospirillum sp. NML02-A-032]
MDSKPPPSCHNTPIPNHSGLRGAAQQRTRRACAQKNAWFHLQHSEYHPKGGAASEQHDESKSSSRSRPGRMFFRPSRTRDAFLKKDRSTSFAPGGRPSEVPAKPQDKVKDQLPPQTEAGGAEPAAASASAAVSADAAAAKSASAGSASAAGRASAEGETVISSEVLSVELMYEHLNKVSRSFALTIPLIPNPLRDCISLAYLLCRVVDTVEDDARAPLVDRITWLSDFSFLSGSDFADLDVLQALKKRALELTSTGGSAADDIELLKVMDKAVNLLLSYDEEIQAVLCRALSIMSHGMSSNLRRRLHEANHTVSDLDEVDSYCYFVAGVVGEMLAELFVLHDREVDKKELLELAVSFGEGLQLTNILRDRARDATRGVSFIPASSEEEVLEYVAITEGHLSDAIAFICSLSKKESAGVRLFCFTNVVMALYLLRQIASRPMDPKCDYRISHSMLRRLLLLSRLAVRSNLGVRLLSMALTLGMRSQKRSVRQLRDKVSIWDHSPNTN